MTIAIVAARVARDRALREEAANRLPPEHPVRNAPYVQTPADVVERMVALAEIEPDDLVYDLGCGDGRLVIAAARQHGCRGVGLDIDPRRIAEAQANARQAGVDDRVQFVEADILKHDFSQADAVLMYLLPKLNEALIPQLQRLRPGSRIVSHSFELKGIKPEAVVRFDSTVDGEQHAIYVFRTPLARE